MPDTGISIIWGGVAAAAITAVAAITSAIIARQVKISEFRQAWINALRDDIAEYISMADAWMDIYEDINTADTQDEKKTKLASANAARYALLRVLHRIEMRFNPLDNPNKATDDAFLVDLSNLVDPGKLPPDDLGGISRSAWNAQAKGAVLKARHILKREWEVTKHPLIRRLLRMG